MLAALLTTSPGYPMRGFLLIECLLATSILALLSTMMLRSWQQQQNYLSLENTTQALMTFLAQAQTLATQQQQTLSVQREFTNQGEWCFWIGGLSAQHDCQNSPLFWKLTDYRVKLLTTPTFPSPKFYGYTGATQATRITLSADAQRIRVVISSKGRLSRCSEHGNFGSLRACR